MSRHYDAFGELDENDGYDDEEELEESFLGDEGCLFPGYCCMPGPHFTSECHTPEMAEDYARSLRGEAPVATLTLAPGVTFGDLSDEQKQALAALVTGALEYARDLAKKGKP